MMDIDALTDRRENLSPAKRALLELRLKKKREAAPQIPPIVQCLRTETLPLSFAQQRLWFLHQWDPASTQYTIPVAFRLHGPLQIEALEQAINALVARHESLRTTFTLESESPHQHIHTAQTNQLSILHISHGSSEGREAKILQMVEHEIQRPFDLSQGPLFRATLIGVTNQDHVLILALHHIITDGWSMGILYKELSLLYNAQISDTCVSLPVLPIQYADFSVWQRRWLQDETLDRQLKYWKSQLDGMPASLELPTDFLRPPVQLHKGASQTLHIGGPLTQALQTLSQQQGCTLFMTLLAAFQVLLARYTGHDDIVVGVPIANRTQQELEGVVGFFVNTLVLRTQLNQNLTFRQVLARVQKICVAAYTHQDLPFEKLVEELNPTRDPSRTPLIQTLFQLERGNQRTASFTGLDVERLKGITSTSKMDLSVSFVEQSDGLTANVEYDIALFKSATITRLIEHFQNLLKGIVANPDQLLGELPLLSTAERTTILETWNSTSQPYPESHCVHQIFEAQVALTPEAIAVVSDEEQITYQHLNQRATFLARYLQQLGVGPEIRVGLYLERSVNMVVALLGILKTGGVYVPLDPINPNERLMFMIHDAGIDVLLTQSSLRDNLDSLTESSLEVPRVLYRVISLDTDWPNLAQVPVPFSSPKVNADNLAYVIYTSGSTGLPKGVCVPHRAIVRLVMNTDYVCVTSSDRIAHLANVSFDAATFEIWGSLLNGAQAVVFGSDIVLSPNRFQEAILETGITTMFVTTALFNLLTSEAREVFASLHCVLFGGETVNFTCVRAVLQHKPPQQLLHVYGPTENTTFSTWHHVSELKETAHTVSIGRPIANTQVILLARNQQLVPIGVPGELYIGGAGLARGYIDQPALTAERFIPHAYSNQPGCRLYRSGDMARFQEDGTIEFLGRQDHQVKVRGYRIECGEIETLLTTHPAVREVVVMPREDSVGNKRLVAYIVFESGSIPNISELRDLLSLSLPSYMIPTDYVFLSSFPLTVNGKINRSKLPTEAQSFSQEEGTYVAPRNSLENQLTKIWENMFERKPIGVTDNFFSLGGESLMAVRLCSKMEQALKKKIPVPLIFHAQTIEQLAKRLEQDEEDEPSPLMVPIQPNGSNLPIFCVLLGATFMPYVKNFPNQPLYMFFNQGHDGKPALHTTVEEIATWYLNNMRTIQPEGPYYLAGYSFGGMVAYEMAQQLQQQGQVVAFLALVDPTTPRLQSSQSTWSKQLRSALTENEDRSRSLFPRGTTVLSLLSKVPRGLLWRTQNLFSLNRFKKIACKAYFTLGYPLAPSLQQFYRDNVVAQAWPKYVPQPYSGEIILFQTNKTLESYWGKLCTNIKQVYELPAGHHEIVSGQYTENLFRKLMDCLEKAQKKHG